MMENNANEPVSPIKLYERIECKTTGNITVNECELYHAGLTKREHFAGLAMQGLLSNSGGPIQANQMRGFSFCNCNDADVAILSVQMADALLAELD